MDQLTEKEALEKAIAFFGGRGAKKRFALAMNVSDMVVSNWLKRQLPADEVLTVERVCGYTVSRHQLRPSLYPLDFDCQCVACQQKKAA